MGGGVWDTAPSMQEIFVFAVFQKVVFFYPTTQGILTKSQAACAQEREGELNSGVNNENK